MKLRVELIFIVILFPCLYISIQVFNSYRIQLNLLAEFNRGIYEENTTKSFINLNSNFPNIGVTTIPIDHFLSKYYFLSEDFEKSLSLIESGNKANPFIKSGSMYKAELYEYLGVYDSMYFYAKDAFNKMPRTTKHYLYYTKSMLKLGRESEFIDSYNSIKGFKEREFFVSFFVTLNQFNVKNDSLIDIANSVREKFINEDIVKVAIDHYLYGTDNVESSIENTNEAIKYFQTGQYDNAITSFKNATELNPGEYSNFENIGLSYYRLMKYAEASEYFKTVIEKKSRPKKGKSELYLGLSLIKSGEKEKGCEYLNLARSQNVAEAYKHISKNCN